MSNCFKLKQTVYIEDVDSYGVVYYANYLKYFERARTEWLLHHLGTLTSFSENNILFAVRSAHIDYHRPLLLQDTFTITATAQRHKRVSTRFEQTIYTDNPEQPVTSAEITLVCINQNHKPVPLPSEFLALYDT